MVETFGFFLATFIIIFFARPVASFFKIPTLTIYIISGILAGPSGIGLIKDVSSLNYFYEIGIILLMFSAGLELMIQPVKKTTKTIKNMFLFNLIIPGIIGLVYGLLIANYFYIKNLIFLSLFMVILFSSPASEVVIQQFREFGKKIDLRRKQFSQHIIMSSVFADLFSLLLFTIIFALHISKNYYDLIKFFGFGITFFLFIFKGLPVLHDKILARFKGMNTSEEETTTLLMLVVVVVTLGAMLQIPPVVCSFFAGISLANVHINRMVRNNINFITSGIFVPIFFIIIGAKVNLFIFSVKENLVIAITTICILMFIRAVSIYIASRIEGFSFRNSLGFGFVCVPQLTGAIATSIVFYNHGLLSEVLFNSIIILTIITTISGTFLARILLFPGITHPTKEIFVEDFYIDFKPFNLLTTICDIARRLKDSGLSVYPVVDNENIYVGVVHLDDVRDTMFSEEISCLVISADVVDRKYPVIEKESTIQEAIKIFNNPGVHAIPVVETIDGKHFYTGMLLLQDILPEIHYIRS